MKGYKKGKEFERPFAGINSFSQNFVLKVYVEKTVREKQKIYRRCCAVGHSNLCQGQGRSQERTTVLETYVEPGKIQDFLFSLNYHPQTTN